jgi:hypothetical protein
MTVAEVTEKWTARIEQCQAGDGQSVRRVIVAGVSELMNVPCSVWELLDATGVLYGHAVLQAEPRLTLEDVAARWATLVGELPGCGPG